MPAQLELILGGVRSGKSRLAERRAVESQKNKIYIATATGDDEEMARRIKQHQMRRQKGQDWRLHEEPIHLADALLQCSDDSSCLLVDCLTLWLSNCLHAKCWEQERLALFSKLPDLSGRVIFVSNEVGLGVVPMGAISREFVDESGLLHQELAHCCQRVTFTVSGMPFELTAAPDV